MTRNDDIIDDEISFLVIPIALMVNILWLIPQS